MCFYITHSYTQEFVPVISIIDSGQVASDAQFVGIQYVPDTETVCIAASTGEVVTFSAITNEVCEGKRICEDECVCIRQYNTIILGKLNSLNSLLGISLLQSYSKSSCTLVVSEGCQHECDRGFRYLWLSFIPSS